MQVMPFWLNEIGRPQDDLFEPRTNLRLGCTILRYYIDKAKGVARTSSTDLRPGALEFPLIPMLGCIGTAPRNKEAVSTSTPGSFGGNLDFAGMVAGVKVMLPVYEPGALLFIGDGHARQGHGELVGTGLEISMDVEFTVDLVKKKTIGWPRLENDEYIMVLGSERPLLQAENSQNKRGVLAAHPMGHSEG